MEGDEIQSHFLQIHLARLNMARLLGTLDRWIKGRVEDLSYQDLFNIEEELWRWSKIEGEGRKTLGQRLARLHSHPLYNLLFERSVQKEMELEELDPEAYLGPFYSFSESEIRAYLNWKGEAHGTIQEWHKEKKKSLPVLKAREDRAGQGSSDNGEGSVNGGSNNKDSLSDIPISKGKKRAYSPGAGKKKEKRS